MTLGSTDLRSRIDTVADFDRLGYLLRMVMFVWVLSVTMTPE
jgi:hypothetical protein